MPRIPLRTEARQPGSVSFGRISAAELPGAGEQTALRQLDAVVGGGLKLGDVLASRQEKRRRENDDLAANEAFLAYQGASYESETEFDRTVPTQSEGMFVKWKLRQEKIYDNSTKNLTSEQREIFDRISSGYSLAQNARIARKEAALHDKRIDDNFQASATAASLAAMREIARPSEFYRSINSARRFNRELMSRKGVNEKDIETRDALYLSKAVSEAIMASAALSYENAEKWYSEAVGREELLPGDALKARSALDRRKTADDENRLLNWAQSEADYLIAEYGDDRKKIYETVQKRESGEREVALKREVKQRFSEMAEQRAADQRELLKRGKIIVDESATVADAKERVREIMASPKASIDTAKKIDSYINRVFAVGRAAGVTNPRKLDELYTNINKTIANTASPEEIIDSAETIEVRYGPHLSVSDVKNAQNYLRNNGFFGKTAYNDLLASFSSMKEQTVADTKRNEEDMAQFSAFMKYALPLLPPDKAVNPADLRRISADFFLEARRKGQTYSPGIFLDYYDKRTYLEAVAEGDDKDWLPMLNDEEEKLAERLIAEENSLRISRFQSPISNTERNRRAIYKQRVMMLP